MQEEWRDIPGYEGKYQASASGNIRSVKGGRRLGVILAQTEDTYGYSTVALYNGCEKRHRVHRLIYATFNGDSDFDHLEIDHINCDIWDNRIENLRACTRQQNSQHRSIVKSTTGYKGVSKISYVKTANPYHARIKANGKHISIGCYQNSRMAAKAYDAMAKKLFGEFAYLNFQETT